MIISSSFLMGAEAEAKPEPKVGFREYKGLHLPGYKYAALAGSYFNPFSGQYGSHSLLTPESVKMVSECHKHNYENFQAAPEKKFGFTLQEKFGLGFNVTLFTVSSYFLYRNPSSSTSFFFTAGLGAFFAITTVTKKQESVREFIK